MKIFFEQRSKSIGMKEGDTFLILGKVMARLCKLLLPLLDYHSSIPVNHCGEKVLNSLSDANSNKIIALDHLLTGIGKCITDSCFHEI